MSIALARIDDRLIHGQVTEGWFKKFPPDIVIVVSNTVASSEWQGELCLAALPVCYRGCVVNVAHAPEVINDTAKEDKAVYVLFESPKDALDVISGGADIKELNVGGMHAGQGKQEISNYIYLDKEDVLFLRALKDAGVSLNFRDLPDHENIDVMSRIEKNSGL